MSDLGGRKTTDLHGMFAPRGGYIFTGHLASGTAPAAGAATLTIGDLPIVGKILAGRGGEDSPAHPAFVFAGGDGWNAPLPAPGGAYAASSGVRLSTVLKDLARICGEAYDAPADVILGVRFGWDASAVSGRVTGATVLAGLVSRGAIPTWRVDPLTGRTRFDAWPTLGAADGKGVVSDRALAYGVREVALTSSVRAWLPGGTVQGVSIRRLTLTEQGGELRGRVADA